MNMFASEDFYLERAQQQDLQEIAAVYNSNPAFLITHLGCRRTSEEWVAAELADMKEAGFDSYIIADQYGMGRQAASSYENDQAAYLSSSSITGCSTGFSTTESRPSLHGSSWIGAAMLRYAILLNRCVVYLD